MRHRGSFADSVPQLGAVYPSDGWRDDVAWGAAWLYCATRETAYLDLARAFLAESRREEAGRCCFETRCVATLDILAIPLFFMGRRWQYFVANWNNMLWSTNLLLARSTGEVQETAAATDFIDRWRTGRVARRLPCSASE